MVLSKHLESNHPTFLFIWTRDLTRKYDKAQTFLKNVFHNELQQKPLNVITENFIVWLMRLNGLSPKSLIVTYFVV
jgi:hypothetical protein